MTLLDDGLVATGGVNWRLAPGGVLTITGANGSKKKRSAMRLKGKSSAKRIRVRRSRRPSSGYEVVDPIYRAAFPPGRHDV